MNRFHFKGTCVGEKEPSEEELQAALKRLGVSVEEGGITEKTVDIRSRVDRDTATPYDNLHVIVHAIRRVGVQINECSYGLAENANDAWHMRYVLSSDQAEIPSAYKDAGDILDAIVHRVRLCVSTFAVKYEQGIAGFSLELHSLDAAHESELPDVKKIRDLFVYSFNRIGIQVKDLEVQISTHSPEEAI